MKDNMVNIKAIEKEAEQKIDKNFRSDSGKWLPNKISIFQDCIDAYGGPSIFKECKWKKYILKFDISRGTIPWFRRTFNNALVFNNKKEAYQINIEVEKIVLLPELLVKYLLSSTSCKQFRSPKGYTATQTNRLKRNSLSFLLANTHNVMYIDEVHAGILGSVA